MEMADDINKYINDSTPWKKELNEAIDISSSEIYALRLISIYLHTIIPNITKYKYVFNVFSQPNSDKANFVYIGEKK